MIHSLNGGGAERVIAGLASRLAGRGHDVVLVTLDDGENDRHKVSPKVQRASLNVVGDGGSIAKRLVQRLRRQRVLSRAMQQAQCDVWLSFCDQVNVLALLSTFGTSALVRPGFSLRPRFKMIVSERSDPNQQPLRRLDQWARKRLYRYAAATVALTEASATTLRGWGCERVHVIPSAVDEPPSYFAPANPRTEVIAVGRLEYEKGFDRLLDAFARLSKTHPQWRLRILGEGSLRADLTARARHLGIGDLVELPGWIAPVWDRLREASIFVLPSRYEGFPSALLEAMAIGLPCVAVDCESGPRAIIDPDVDGLLVGNDLPSLVEGLRQLMDDDELRQRLGLSAQRVVQRFGWDAMVDQYEALLIDCV